MNKLRLILVFILLALSTVSCSNKVEVQGPAGELVLGYLNVKKDAELDQAMESLGAALEKKLKRGIKVKDYEDPNLLLRDLQLGKTQLSYTGPLTYVMLSEIVVLYPLATASYGDFPHTNTAIITLVEQPWNSLDELIDQAEQIRFSLSGYSSLTGYLIPMMEFSERDAVKNPREHQFKQLTISTKHETTARGIIQQVFDAGAVDRRTLEYMIDAGFIDGQAIKTIWTSPNIYSYTLAAAETLDRETIGYVRRAVLGLKQADHEFYDQLGIGQFISIQQQNYLYIRQIAYKNNWLNWDSGFAND